MDVINLSIQDEMIGRHPDAGIFAEWLSADDTQCTDTKRHRHLLEKQKNIEVIDTIAQWIITHHLTENKKKVLKRKKEILEKYEFNTFAKKLHIFPQVDTTKKGNLGEVILTEYLAQTTGLEVLIYKLRYNPNVDQSMKGDDVLLVDSQKIFLGESKFRSSPTKEVVKEIGKSMNDDLSLPISLGFIADRLFEENNEELAEKILELQLDLSRLKVDIKNIGFILSTPKVRDTVERNMKATNNNFIFITLGIENPIELMESVFQKAEQLIQEGEF